MHRRAKKKEEKIGFEKQIERNNKKDQGDAVCF